MLSRAKQILRELESGNGAPVPKQAEIPREDPAQMTFSPPGEEEVMRRLRELDVNTLTPIECMNQLFELCRLAKTGNETR